MLILYRAVAFWYGLETFGRELNDREEDKDKGWSPQTTFTVSDTFVISRFVLVFLLNAV